MPQHKALIALGANLGDAHASLGLALERLNKLPSTQVRRASSIYSSNPVGGPTGQPRFFNAVSEITTSLTPFELLNHLQELETELGRVRAETWSARSLDLDILSYDSIVSVDPHLILPHPRMTVRRFVMEPLAEIDPCWKHPQLGWSAEQIKDWLIRGPRLVRFSTTFKSMVAATSAGELSVRFESLEPGWSILEESRDVMFEIYSMKELSKACDWRIPHFYPTEDVPNAALAQVIATCRGLTDSIFRV